MKPWLYDISFYELSKWLANQGQPPFRTQQVFEWAYQRDAGCFEEMTNLPRDLREVLAACYDFGPLPVRAATEGHHTSKLLLAMPGGGEVECVRIKMGGAHTACLSTQVGCAVRCVFCATGQMRCERGLTSGEMIAQLMMLRRHRLRADVEPPRITNVVFMGMGEPFHNYDATVATVQMLTEKRGLGMSPSKIVVSTSGVAPMIRKYATEHLGTELAVSLNAPNDELRQKLMPGVASWSVKEVATACKQYSSATGGQPVTFSYVLIDGVNDLLDHSRELAQLLRRQPHHVNVIPLNPVSHSDMHAPNRDRTSAFVDHCRKFGLHVSLRKSKGVDIDAACGQLRTRAGQADDRQEKVH